MTEEKSTPALSDEEKVYLYQGLDSPDSRKGMDIILANPEYSPRSMRIVGLVWRKVCHLLDVHRTSPLMADPAVWREISFEMTPPASHRTHGRRKEHARRTLVFSDKLLHLIDEDLDESAAGIAVRQLGQERLVNDPTLFLSTHRVRRFLDYLRSGPCLESLSRRRDAAFAGLCACAGAKPAQVGALTVSALLDVSRSATIDLPRIPSVTPASYSAPLLDPIGEILRHFIEAIDLAVEPQSHPFLMRFAPGKQLAEGPVPHSLWHRRVSTLLRESGVAPDRRYGPQTLRNCYAAHWFARGTELSSVMKWMGFSNMESIYRLKSSWIAWGDRLEGHDDPEPSRKPA